MIKCSSVYYNENDPRAADWLRELISAGAIPHGHIDTRSISEVQPEDLADYRHCHFFAGIGGWAQALRLASWDPDEPVWTGSCPCPPFSSAGKKKWCPQCSGKPIPHPLKTGIFACVECGHEWLADARHLWPEFFRLIRLCRPAIVFGEQVAGNDGLIWLAGVRATLEGVGYGVGSADLCAAGERSPHIRQRLWWVANAAGPSGSEQFGKQGASPWRGTATGDAAERAGSGRVADAEHAERRPDPSDRQDGRHGQDGGGQEAHSVTRARCEIRGTGTLADVQQQGLEGHAGNVPDGHEPGRLGTQAAGPTPAGGSVGFWDDYVAIPCLDGKARRAQPGIFPLAHGIPGRVGLLRGYGNAIVPQVAAHFIETVRHVLNEL